MPRKLPTVDEAISKIHSDKVRDAITALDSTKLPSEMDSISGSISGLARDLDERLLNKQEKVVVFIKLRELKHSILDALKIILICFLLSPSTLFAQTLLIAGDEEVPAYKIVKLKAVGLEEKAGILWKVLPSKNLSLPVNTPLDMYEFTAPPGIYEISLLSIKLKPDGSTSLKEATKTVVILRPSPDPGPKPIPPDPGPTPIPPDPKPLPPAPIPVEGFRVLMVYERADLSKMPAKQVDILHSQQIADYLNKTCVVGPDGKMPEWRAWDQNADTSATPKLWQDAMKRERKSLPWIVISTGKTGFEGPLPATIEETLTLLRSYGSK